MVKPISNNKENYEKLKSICNSFSDLINATAQENRYFQTDYFKVYPKFSSNRNKWYINIILETENYCKEWYLDCSSLTLKRNGTISKLPPFYEGYGDFLKKYILEQFT